MVRQGCCLFFLVATPNCPCHELSRFRIAFYALTGSQVKHNLVVIYLKYARLVQPPIGSGYFGGDARLTPAELAAKKAKQAEDASGAFEELE